MWIKCKCELSWTFVRFSTSTITFLSLNRSCAFWSPRLTLIGIITHSSPFVLNWMYPHHPFTEHSQLFVYYYINILLQHKIFISSGLQYKTSLTLYNFICEHGVSTAQLIIQTRQRRFTTISQKKCSNEQKIFILTTHLMDWSDGLLWIMWRRSSQTTTKLSHDTFRLLNLAKLKINGNIDIKAQKCT